MRAKIRAALTLSLHTHTHAHSFSDSLARRLFTGSRVSFVFVMCLCDVHVCLWLCVFVLSPLPLHLVREEGVKITACCCSCCCSRCCCTRIIIKYGIEKCDVIGSCQFADLAGREAVWESNGENENVSSERAFVCFLFGRKRSQFVHARLCLCVCVYASRDRQSENVCSNFARTAANQEKLLNKIVFGVKALRKYRQMIKQTTTTATHEPEHAMTNMSKTCLIFLFLHIQREINVFMCVWASHWSHQVMCEFLEAFGSRCKHKMMKDNKNNIKLQRKQIPVQ